MKRPLLKKQIVIILALFLALPPAASYSADGLYVAAAMGASLQHSNRLEGGNPPIPLPQKAGTADSIAAGYRLNRTRFEGEYSNSSLSYPNSYIPFDNDLNIDSYMVNVLFDFLPGSVVSPFAGAGMGSIKVTRDYHTVSAGNSGSPYMSNSAYDTHIGYQLSAGISLAATENLNLDLYYRYRSALSDFKLGEGYTLPYKNSNFMLGLRFTFDPF